MKFTKRNVNGEFTCTDMFLAFANGFCDKSVFWFSEEFDDPLSTLSAFPASVLCRKKRYYGWNCEYTEHSIIFKTRTSDVLIQMKIS